NCISSKEPKVRVDVDFAHGVACFAFSFRWAAHRARCDALILARDSAASRAVALGKKKRKDSQSIFERGIH
ncbi:MAG: hypothetical protein WB869_18480, partial [Candidatus Acidiferrales bacterium]